MKATVFMILLPWKYLLFLPGQKVQRNKLFQIPCQNLNNIFIVSDLFNLHFYIKSG